MPPMGSCKDAVDFFQVPSNTKLVLSFNNDVPDSEKYKMLAEEDDNAWRTHSLLSNNPKQCMQLLLSWRNVSCEQLAEYIGISPKTISRIMNGRSQPNFETAALICFGLRLPPYIQQHLLRVLGCNPNLKLVHHRRICDALCRIYAYKLDDVRLFLNEFDVQI